MQFGLFGGALAPRGPDAAASARGYHDFVAAHVEAERLGYHASFVTEHHFTGVGQVSATLTLLAWVAARTRRLRLGTAVLTLPWHNPVLLAEQAAMLDLLSGGRLDLGVGKGYRHNEFQGFGVLPSEAEARFEEALELMVRALGSDARFSHAGCFWRFDDILVEPPPCQRPHPPIWIAAGSAGSIAAVARKGFNLLLDQFASPAEIGARIALYRQGLEAAGHAFDPLNVAVARNLALVRHADEKGAALRAQTEVHARLAALARGDQARPGAHMLAYSDAPGARESHTLIGTAPEVIEGLAALRDHGVAYVLLNDYGDASSRRRFADEVAPRLG